MKVVHIETLISRGTFADSKNWKRIHSLILKSIESISWPEGNDSFAIYPEKGKDRGKGNGVTPIKKGLITKLEQNGWSIEEPLNFATRKRPGNIDAVLYDNDGTIALEWETGNISSSHRSLNKLCLGLIKKKLIAGILVVPSRNLYQFLTDRVGNWDELEPYIDFWKNIKCSNGILEIIVIEHDTTSLSSPKIPKGTDGRALN